MECLPWDTSLEIYRKELQVSGVLEQSVRRLSDDGKVPSRLEIRKVTCDFYLEEITRSCLGKVEQPVGKAGLLLPFRNNILHKGGYPEPERARYVCVFHCYPSHKPTPYERYSKLGVKKTAPYLVNPAADF